MTKYLMILVAMLLIAACSSHKAAPNDSSNDGDSDTAAEGDPITVMDDAETPDIDLDDFTWPVETETVTITPSVYWKNEVDFPNDEFANSLGTGYDTSSWIKFAVIMKDPTKVYFQDSRKYLFHYDFASKHLDPWVGISTADFDAVTLHVEGQELILGAVLFALNGVNEFGVQLVRSDPYHPKMAEVVLKLVQAAINSETPLQGFYFPTPDQYESAVTYDDFYENAGFPVSSAARWELGSSCYATGWAIGRLKYVASADIEAAYGTGELLPTDILLTDIVPAELPPVAGIVALTPSTMNSHVALLAKTFGVPFVYLPDEWRRDEIVALEGKEIALRASQPYGPPCTVRFAELVDLGEADRAKLLGYKEAAALTFPAKERLGTYVRAVKDITPGDVRYFGGKASNFSMLIKTIPDNIPQNAVAFSFDLFDDFMAQSIGGTVLSTEIAKLLAKHSYPPDMKTLRTDLEYIREKIKTETVFTDTMKTAIEEGLAGFDKNKNIRFRSSTNLEDTAQFVGAGLYDSYSGCLADDTDGDDLGPSICDATEPDERGVYRAIRKVFASFYNENAVIERLRRGVDETKAGMALLVHHSFPADIEAANGVVTMSNGGNREATIVSQPGDISVTNPEGNKRPEIVDATYWSGEMDSWDFTTRQYSDYLQIGDTVLDSSNEKAEYKALMALLDKVSAEFEAVTGKTTYLLDFEYKKDTDGTLIVKQVRELPLPEQDKTVPAFLLAGERKRCVFQGEAGDIFANHRLKYIWDLTTKNIGLTAAERTSTLFSAMNYQYRDESGVLQERGGDPAGFEEYAYADQGDSVADSWRDGDKSYAFQTNIWQPTFPWEQGPLAFADDFYFTVYVTYPEPMITKNYDGWTTTTTESVQLDLCPDDPAAALGVLAEKTGTVGGVTITSRFYYPPAPVGPTSGYTAPLVKWESSVIEGLTATPMTFTGYYSQTFRPEHHNFTEHFLFEPSLEEGISEDILTELTEKNIRYIHMEQGYLPGTGEEGAIIELVGFDGSVTVL